MCATVRGYACVYHSTPLWLCARVCVRASMRVCVRVGGVREERAVAQRARPDLLPPAHHPDDLLHGYRRCTAVAQPLHSRHIAGMLPLDSRYIAVKSVREPLESR